MRPSRASSMISSIGEIARFSSSTGGQVGRHYLPRLHSRARIARQHVDLEIDLGARLQPAKVVTSQVCGMISTPKTSSSTSLTVSDTPSTAIEPFGAMKRAAAGRADADAVRRPSPSVVTDSTSPDAIDVARDDVAAQFVAEAERRVPD